MEISGVGVQQNHLALACLYNMRMTMPDMRYVVDRIQIGPPRFII